MGRSGGGWVDNATKRSPSTHLPKPTPLCLRCYCPRDTNRSTTCWLATLQPTTRRLHRSTRNGAPVQSVSKRDEKKAGKNRKKQEKTGKNRKKQKKKRRRRRSRRSSRRRSRRRRRRRRRSRRRRRKKEERGEEEEEGWGSGTKR